MAETDGEWTEWAEAQMRYDPDVDAIAILGSNNQVAVLIPRNRVIEMIGMLPANPPEKSDG